MNNQNNLKLLAAAGMSFCLPLTLQAGEPVPMPYTPAPTSDCANPGWHLDLAALYLQAGSSEGYSDPSPDSEFGFRGSLAYETASGLFFKTTYFGWDGDLDDDGDSLEMTNWDFLVGDTICCNEDLSLEIAAGLRRSTYEEDDNYDVEGWGPVFSIEAQRRLSGPWSLYAGITQAFVIGDDDEEDYDNVIYGITEIAAGVQFDFALGDMADAYVRLGGEGQYYYGAAEGDTQDVGLFGAALELGFDF